MNVTSLLEAIRSAREEYDMVLDAVREEDYGLPGVAGKWSVKDVVAHIVWHEKQMIELVNTRALQGSPWWMLSTPERNEEIYALYKERSADDVLTEARDVYAELLNALSALTDEDLNDPSQFENMPPEWQPWRILAQNTYEHYLRHISGIRQLIEHKSNHA